MSETDDTRRITLRIPGDWAHPGKLLERLPAGYRLTPDALMLPDQTEIEFIPMPPDDQFPQIFRTSCRRPATRDELAIVNRYTVNVSLTGPGGSREAALAMMQAGAAIVRAGGAGVFIDNSAMAHGGRDWIEMTKDGGTDAMSFAFTAVIEGRSEAYTMGLRALGLPDLAMSRADIDEYGGDSLIDILRYVCGSDRPVDIGHIFADEKGPRFKVAARTSDEFGAESPMHNPLGRLKIASMKSLARGN